MNGYPLKAGKNQQYEGAHRARSGDRWGVMNDRGGMILSFRFEAIGKSHLRGIAIMLAGRWGVVDARGRMLFPAQFEAVKAFSNKLVAFSEGGLWGFADHSGRIVVSRRYSNISDHTVSVGKLQGFIDDNGQELLKPLYKSVSRFSKGVWIVQNGESWQFIDSDDGSIITEQRLAEATSRDKGGLSSAKFLQGDGAAKNVKIGYIDDHAKIVIAPRFDEAEAFVDGRAKVSIGGKCGYIDRTGRESMPLLYDHCERFGSSTLVGEERPYVDPAHTRTYTEFAITP